MKEQIQPTLSFGATGKRPRRSPQNGLKTAHLLSIITSAVADPATDAARLELLLKMQERVENRAAKKAFDAAIANAKTQISPIFKEHAAAVGDATDKSGSSYRFEGFDTIARAVDPVLGPLGLSYRFRPECLPEKRLRMTCILSHKDGHSEESSLEGYEDHSGKKNSIQAIGSACTYLQRYTLKAALGLAATTDTDAAEWDSEPDRSRISDDQRNILEQRVASLGADLSRFLRFLNVPSLDDLLARDFDKAVQALDQKERKLVESRSAQAVIEAH